MINHLTIFLSNKHDKIHKKPIMEIFGNHMKWFIYIEDLDKYLRYLRQFWSDLNTINIILISKYDCNYNIMSVFVRSFRETKFIFIIGTNNGIDVHEHILEMPSSTIIISLANNCWSFNGTLLYELTRDYNNINAILYSYVLSFQHSLIIPEIYFSVHWNGSYRIRSIFHYINHAYHTDIHRVIQNGSISEIRKLFVVDHLSDSEIEEQFVANKMLKDIINKKSINSIKDVLYSAQYEKKVVSYNKNKYPLQLTHELNHIFDSHSKLSDLERKVMLRELVSEFFKQNKTVFEIEITVCPWRLRVYDDLPHMIFSISNSIFEDKLE